MTSKALIEYCLKKAGAYLDYPFGPQLAAVRVGKTKEKKGRIFAQFFVLNGTDVVTFNCDVLSVQFFRGKYPDAVQRAWHVPDAQQNYAFTVAVSSLKDEILFDMAGCAYNAAVSKLPKHIRNALDVCKEGR